MAITSTGIGSGLPVDSIVSKLMEIEQQPITALQTKEASYSAQLTAYGNVKSALSTFQTAVKTLSDASKFTAISASTGDSTVLGVSATAGAVPGAFSIEVSKLAQSQKLATNGVAASNTAIGSGTLTFDFGTISGATATNGAYTGATFVSNGAGTKSITIDSSNNTLSGIMTAINNAKMGVTATIINDGGTTPYRLSLTSTSSGAANSMKISVDGGDPALTSLLTQDPAGTQSMKETTAAQNAQFTLDGVAISKATNSVTDAIAGVTLNLKKTNVGTPTNVSVVLDSTAITAAVKQFVDGYNQANSVLSSLTLVAYDESAKKDNSGALGGDSATRGIQTALRRVLTSAISGGGNSFSVLSDIGVSIQKDGTLATDSTKLQKAITDNFSKIAGLFAAVGNTTDTQVAYDSSTTKTKPGTYNVNVTQIATQGTLTGSSAAATTITAGVNDTLNVTLDGVSAVVTLDAGTYASADALAAQVQAKLNGVTAFSTLKSSVAVTQSNGIFSILSNRYGAASNISITGGNGASDLFGAGPTTTTGVDTEGTINGVAAVGTGQFLTGATGDASEGMKIKIGGGPVGARGSVSYSQGYAYQFNQLITAQLDTTGPIATRTDGINATLKTMDKNIEDLQTRYTATEARYRKTYTDLDVTMANLNATSTSLAAQLAKL